jgi:LPXTG-motif cell wall-anchored protein
MSDYEEDDEVDDVEGNEPPAGQSAAAGEEAAAASAASASAAAASSNRNFLLALGVLGGIFVLLIIGLVVLFLLRRPGATQTANIAATNQVIFAANTQTASAATQIVSLLLTPSSTPIPSATVEKPAATNTAVVAQPTATNTAVIAQPTATNTPASGSAAGIFTATPSVSPTVNRTGTVPALLTQSAAQTKTMAVNLTATATRLPKTGFAEDVGLPGLFGLAVGLLIVIVLVRRLRLSTSS